MPGSFSWRSVIENALLILGIFPLPGLGLLLLSGFAGFCDDDGAATLVGLLGLTVLAVILAVVCIILRFKLPQWRTFSVGSYLVIVALVAPLSFGAWWGKSDCEPCTHCGTAEECFALGCGG